MSDDLYDKIIRWLFIGQKFIVACMVIIVLNHGFTEGQKSGTTLGFISSMIISIGIALGVIVLHLATNKGIQIWENLSDWLESKFRLIPTVRRLIVALGVSSFPLLLYWGVSHMQSDITLKILVVLIYGLILPAAIISLARDDKVRDKSPLANYISREVFMQDSQAAVAKAFTVVEHRLKEKIGVHETTNYSGKLINEAYGGECSKLVLFIGGKDRTSQFHDFLSGAYSLLRNPRHHTLVDDDEYTANAAYAVAGLLLNFIDASEKRVKGEDNRELENEKSP